MIDLSLVIDDYLALRRRLGFSLARDEHLLPDFVRYLERAGSEHITTAAALAWAMQPTGVHPAWWRQRLGIVRSFARHLKTIDPDTEVPPVDLLPGHRGRVTPYLYSDADIAALMAATRELKPVLRAATYETLVGLLAVTGLRIGEAIGLDKADIDMADGVVAVRRTKLDKPRELCLHPSTIDALGRYAWRETIAGPRRRRAASSYPSMGPG